MQRAILIKDGTDIKAKDVYSGDISDDTMNEIVINLQVKYPTYTIQLFSTDQDAIFINAVVNSPFLQP